VIAHLLKLLWNRKRRNLLLMIEIFVAALVLLFVVGFGLYYVDNYRQPLGFAYADVWNVRVGTSASELTPTSAEAGETTRQLLLALRDMPQVESAAIAFTGPYDEASWLTNYDDGAGRTLDFMINSVSDDFRTALGLEVVRGRWFDHQDDGAAVQPVVVNERLARMAFGDEDPLGRIFPAERRPQGEAPSPPRRVVGVVRDFRQHGEFDPPGGYMFCRTELATLAQAPRLILVKVRSGTPGAFQEPLTRRLEEVAGSWSMKVSSLEELRAANHRLRLTPLVAVGLVVGFLLLMVALGLTGVLWQNVTHRTREIGVRRALGASSGGIYAQIVGEILVLTTVAVGLAALCVAQLPFVGLLSMIEPRVVAMSVAVSAAVLYALAALCALQPARLAGRVRPAEALHYE
jgi:putative ABC transport system permease protein